MIIPAFTNSYASLAQGGAVMKIQDVNMALREAQPHPLGERPPAAAQEMAFTRPLPNLNEENYQRHINDLVGAITQQGEKLGKRADIKELQKYRELITELMNETVSNSYAFTKNNAFDARGRHRVYAMIKKVNKDLDLIAEEVLKEQSDNLKVLDLVDDIRGLLVDIFL
jgi:uncharacterized protein YaaR (DUF327 family)